MIKNPLTVYCIMNTINGKQYVGITIKTKEKRFNQHITNSQNEYYEKSYLHNAIKKYGKENFTIFELETCKSIPELYDKEKYWIKLLNTKEEGYNLTEGGDGVLGLKFTDKTKQKMRLAKLGKKHTKEHNEKISKSGKGILKPKSLEQRKKISKSLKGNIPWNKGKSLTKEHKINISKGMRGIIQ